MIRTNSELLSRSSAICRVKEMFVPTRSHFTDADGYSMLMPSFGGINYDLHPGDLCSSKKGALLVPGVTVEGITGAAKTYACAGNEVVITSGDARGEKGIFMGKSYGYGPMSVYFPDKTLERMNGEEHFLVRCQGVGLELTDYPQVKLMNIDPALFNSLNITEENGRLIVPVTHCVPSVLIGEGWGNNPVTGDVDITDDDAASCEKYGLSTLRYGDVVFIEHLDCTYYISYVKRSATVGIVIHNSAPGQGIGIGVMPVMSCKNDLLRPTITSDANIAHYLGIEQEV